MHLCLTVECITSGLHLSVFLIRSNPPPPPALPYFAPYFSVTAWHRGALEIQVCGMYGLPAVGKCLRQAGACFVSTPVEAV